MTRRIMGAVVAISIHNNNMNVKTYYIHWAQKLLRYWNSVLFYIISFYYIRNGTILSLSLIHTHTLILSLSLSHALSLSPCVCLHHTNTHTQDSHVFSNE